MARLPHNIERVTDTGRTLARAGANYRYRGYAKDGYCVRLAKRADNMWHGVAVVNDRHFGPCRTLADMSACLAAKPVLEA